MKVLQVIGVLDRGGAETFLMNVFDNINRDKYSFDFLVFHKKQYDYDEKVKELGGNIIYIESPKKIGIIKFIKELKKICKNNKYDVIHAHTLFNCGPCMLAGFLAGVKVRLSHCHSTKVMDEKINFYKKIYMIISKLLINIFSTHCIACGEAAGKYLYYKFKKFIIIKNGINIDKFKYNEDVNISIRNKYNISRNSLVIGHIGRLMYVKNQSYLLEIFKLIQNEIKDSYLIMVGDGEMKNDLINKVKELDLSDRVFFTGSVSNANDYYNAFNVFVFPSLFEGVPYTLIEAQCNGLPIIASNQISKECNISNKIKFLDLNVGTDEWKNTILDNYNYRYDAIKDVIDNGYSIKDTVKKIEKIYGGKI